ncbi:MAG: EpsG family protein [Weeksellaceae bacterium]
MSKWTKENNQDKALKIILFFISPFIAALYSVRNMNTKSSYLVFFLFAVFFGMAFTVSNDRSEYAGDGAHYRATFEDYYSYISDIEYYDGLREFLTFDEGKKDYYFDTLSFYISEYTSNYHWMFMVAAMVFAFFALKSLRFLTSERNFDFSYSSLLLVYLFMVNGIFNINGLRFWTAAWVGVYCIFQIFRNNDKRYFLLLLFTPFIHGSFWFLIALIVIIYFFKRYNKTWITLFFISFFVGNIAVEVLQDISAYLPTFIQRLIASYTSEENLDRFSRGSGFIWVRRLMGFSVRLYLFLMIYFFIQHANKIKSTPATRNLYLFLIPYMTIINLTLSIPSFGNRYMPLAYPVIAYIWLVHFKDVKYKVFLQHLPLVFWFSIYHNILTKYPSVTDLSFYITNPFSLIYKYLF